MNRNAQLCRIAVLGLALLVPGSTARAQGADRLGLQVIGCAPTSTMKTSTGANVGFGLGLQGQWDMSRDNDGSWVLRPRVDGISIPGKLFGKATSNVSFSLIADMLWFTQGQMTGFYLFGGVGANKSSFNLQVPTNDPAVSLPVKVNGNAALAVDAGFGYNFNHTVGFEARYFHSTTTGSFNYSIGPYSASISKFTSNFDAMEVALTFRF